MFDHWFHISEILAFAASRNDRSWPKPKSNGLQIYLLGSINQNIHQQKIHCFSSRSLQWHPISDWHFCYPLSTSVCVKYFPPFVKKNHVIFGSLPRVLPCGLMLCLVFNFLRQNVRKKVNLFYLLPSKWMYYGRTKEVIIMCYSTVAILDNSSEGKQHWR